jgi:hypothetical protein
MARAKTGGRKKGTPNRMTLKRQERIRRVIADIGKLIPNAFKGDGHAFLVAVYKDPRVTLSERIDAAKAAAVYEKPRLVAIEHTGKDGGPIKTEEVSDTDRARALAVFLAKQKAEDAAKD